ncbi:SDR family NAD(P)-dependent oxidoreductase [Streptomyces chartreusis]|uniref:SDR family NAD(P)-dependent oxidoreductase n=1 Tax=Streptomyces chartreusis TaxID=1969 RepID=UPI0036C04DD6
MSDESSNLAIAVIGMSCTFPGATTPEEFWRNVSAGVESLTELTDEDLAAAGVDPATAAAPNYVRRAASIDGIDMFDAGFFGMSPREAELMDPQQRLFLEHCWRVIEAAGYDPNRLGVPVGVYAGAGVNTYIDQVRSNVDVKELNATGAELHDVGSIENDLDYLTTRVSYKLNLTGPSINISTACSTSLVAVHMAAQALRTFECDLALAGGVAVTPPVRSGYLYQEGSISSCDGHTRSFDASSTGTVLGAGVGAVLLKRLEDALADGDVIHSVIIGSAVNNDGADKAGFTAPGVPGQSDVTSTAHAVAGITADTVAYQEAHGTGTLIGDPIEVRALSRAFRESTDRVGYCALGSVKANIGHMDTASGIAGLIKASQAVRHGLVPPQINFSTPNPGIELESSPFFIPTEPMPWQSAAGQPRRAGVSAFGFGGTNAHVVVEEPPARPASVDTGDWRILPVSAREEAAVQEYLRSLTDMLSGTDRPPLVDVAMTLQEGRSRFVRRAAVVARSADEAADALRARAEAPSVKAEADLEIAFLFPGQGAQHEWMAHDLYRNDAVFREHFDRCADLFVDVLDVDLRDLVFTSATDGMHPVNRTEYTQPALFAVEYALARTFESYGVRPSVMIGHSLGEIVAATVAGVFAVEDAVRVVARRAALMAEATPGAMLAVALPAEQVEPLLPSGVGIAAYNAPRLVVASGPADGVAELAAALVDRGVQPRQLRISCAAHSSLMDEAARKFTEFLRDIPMSAPTMRVVSNVTGALLTPQDACNPEYWGRHLRDAVHFTQGLSTLLETVSGPLVEVGPGGGLLSLVRANRADAGDRGLVPAMRHPKDDSADTKVFLTALATLWEHGTEPDWTAGGPREMRRAVLPTYPFQRRRYWVDASSEDDLRLSRRLLQRESDPASWFYGPTWRQTASADRLRAVSGRAELPENVLVVTDKAGVAAGLVDALTAQVRAAGRRAVVLTEADQYLRVTDDLVQLCITDAEHLGLALTEEKRDGESAALVFVAGRDVESTDPQASLALLALGRAVAETDFDGRLTVVTHGAFDVLGHEEPAPAAWLLDGIARVLPRETPNVSCRVVDIDPPESSAAVAEQLVVELSTDQPDVTVAYRRGRRWLRGTEPLTALGTEDAPCAPRSGGTYLITGGLGGIGLSLAEFLAERYQANLIVTGTGAFPAPEDWDGWLAEHGPRDRTSRRILRLRRIQEHGGTVVALSSDVTDATAVQDLIALADETFGGLDGIVHAAGLPGGGLIRALDPDDYLRVLAPKMLGAHHLLRATKGRRLDFIMLFSSLNVVDGRFGIADYTAANSYLDGLAHRCRSQGRSEVIAVDWTGWRDLGMALDAGSSSDGNEEVRELERLTIMSEDGLASFLSEPEGHDVFVRSLALGLPQVHVSTQDLNAIVEQGRRLDVVTALEALGKMDRRRGAYERPEIGTEFESPEDEYEAYVCETLELLLGIDRVGARDNFFALGGNSLIALDVVARAQQRFGVDVNVARFLADPTPRAVGRLLREACAALATR